MTDFTDRVREYCRERDAALLEYSRFLKFYEKYRKPDWAPPSDPKVLEITFHKMRTAIRSFPMTERAISKRWLLDGGYKPEDDGDVPT